MQFDHEKLDVYKLEIQFIEWVTPLIRDSRERYGKLVTEVCDHLDRASLSVLFNTAEGNGKRQRQTRAKFFDDARGSATECAACLDGSWQKALALPRACRRGKKCSFELLAC
jgi:four helix bundle protein